MSQEKGREFHRWILTVSVAVCAISSVIFLANQDGSAGGPVSTSGENR
jgi:hypothetical protein